MHIDELNLPTAVTDRLRDAGLGTVAALLDAGEDGLQAIDGIGPKTARDVLAAAQKAEPSNGNRNADTEPDASARNDADNPEPHSAEDGNQDADANETESVADEPDPNERVTVRNVSDAMLLVGERYLLPGQRRRVHRRQIRHIGTEKLEIRE